MYTPVPVLRAPCTRTAHYGFTRFPNGTQRVPCVVEMCGCCRIIASGRLAPRLGGLCRRPASGWLVGRFMRALGLDLDAKTRQHRRQCRLGGGSHLAKHRVSPGLRSEETTAELQSLLRTSYAVF